MAKMIFNRWFGPRGAGGGNSVFYNRILSGAVIWISPFLQLQTFPFSARIPSMINYGVGNYQISQIDTRRQLVKTIRNGAPMISSGYRWFNLSSTLVATPPYTAVMVSQRDGFDATTHGFIGSDVFDQNSVYVYTGAGYGNQVGLRGQGSNINHNTGVDADGRVRTFVAVNTGFSTSYYYTGRPVFNVNSVISGNPIWTRMANGVFYGGEFGDIAYFDRALSPGEVSDVMSYLESIYPL
jgi:hypothetical protein